MNKRETKFKGWNGKKFVPVYQIQFQKSGIVARDKRLLKLTHIRQFTGELDKNNVEIYKNDVCKIDGGGEPIICRVLFENGCFCVEWAINDSKPELKYYVGMDFCNIEVVGNDIENPELLPKNGA